MNHETLQALMLLEMQMRQESEEYSSNESAVALLRVQEAILLYRKGLMDFRDPDKRYQNRTELKMDSNR